MTKKANYLLTISMDVDADKEALFNEVYDNEHIPLLLKVPGVVSAKRYKMEPLSMIVGGETKTVAMEGEPKYLAVYELENPDVLIGEGWARAVDSGRWPGEVRPYTRNRRHVLRKLIP